MAEPKRGSKEAFLESEKRRKDRVKSKAKGFNIFKLSGVDKRKKENEAFNKKVKAKNLKARNENPSYKKFVESETRRLTRLTKANPNNKVVKKKLEKHLAKVQPKTEIKKDFVSKAFIAKGADLASKSGAATKTETKNPLAQPKKVAADTTAKVKTDAKVNLSSFGEAFKKARAQGVGTKFAYNDKQYAAVTKDDIRRSGASSLTEFLNKTKRQETKIAKAPGQITEMKQQGGMAGGLTGSIDRLKERLKHVYQSDILTKGNEIYVLCKIDPETGDHYYAFERAPNIIEAQRKSMGLSKSRFNIEYWGMKQEYLTKKLGNKIIFNFTKM